MQRLCIRGRPQRRWSSNLLRLRCKGFVFEDDPSADEAQTCYDCLKEELADEAEFPKDCTGAQIVDGDATTCAKIYEFAGSEEAKLDAALKECGFVEEEDRCKDVDPASSSDADLETCYACMKEQFTDDDTFPTECTATTLKTNCFDVWENLASGNPALMEAARKTCGADE